MNIRDTSKFRGTAEADMILADARTGGKRGPGAIEEMEREGKAQLLNSDRLPADVRDREAFEALGFTFGEPDQDDPMFMPATFPPGWRREGSNHAMWSYIVDEFGRHRVAVFYKAAFYDRRAFMRLESLSWYVTEHVEYGKPLTFDGKWATREAVVAEMRQARESNLKEAADFRRYAADAASRDEKNRADCAMIADDKDATAAKYEAALNALSA
jgi:hypothetical protein